MLLHKQHLLVVRESALANTVKTFLNGELYTPGRAIPDADVHKIDFRCASRVWVILFPKYKTKMDTLIQLMLLYMMNFNTFRVDMTNISARENSVTAENMCQLEYGIGSTKTVCYTEGFIISRFLVSKFTCTHCKLRKDTYWVWFTWFSVWGCCYACTHMQ